MLRKMKAEVKKQPISAVKGGKNFKKEEVANNTECSWEVEIRHKKDTQQNDIMLVMVWILLLQKIILKVFNLMLSKCSRRQLTGTAVYMLYILWIIFYLNDEKSPVRIPVPSPTELFGLLFICMCEISYFGNFYWHSYE